MTLTAVDCLSSLGRSQDRKIQIRRKPKSLRAVPGGVQGVELVRARSERAGRSGSRPARQRAFLCMAGERGAGREGVCERLWGGGEVDTGRPGSTRPHVLTEL